MMAIYFAILVSLLGSCTAFRPFPGRFSVRGFALNDAGEKLVFDEKTNRFYEALTGDEVKDKDTFFLTDKDTGKPILLTTGEKERIFLDSIQSFYFSGKSSLSDDEFDRLREDLSWEGSDVLKYNRNETLFINAVQAYKKGKPIISDKEFDTLKAYLREVNSKIVVDKEPQCYVDTNVCKVTWDKDAVKSSSLYFPAILISTIVYLGIFDEFFNIVGININPLIALAIGAVPISTFAKTITEDIFFKKTAGEPSFVAKGACPKCNTENSIFFGSVLGIEGFGEQATVKCTNCKANLTVKRSTLRVSTLLADSGAAVAAE